MSCPVIEKTWKSLKCVLWNKGSNSEKAISCMTPTIWNYGKDKTLETIKWWVSGCHVLRDDKGRMKGWSTEDF